MGKCEAGCKYFTGNEVKHHRDCFYYKDSLSELQDKREKRITALEALAKQMVDALEDCHKLIDKKVKCDTKVFGFYREHDPSQCAACISFNKSKEALDAYKRGING